MASFICSAPTPRVAGQAKATAKLSARSLPATSARQQMTAVHRPVTQSVHLNNLRDKTDMPNSALSSKL